MNNDEHTTVTMTDTDLIPFWLVALGLVLFFMLLMNTALRGDTYKRCAMLYTDVEERLRECGTPNE